MTSDTHCRRSYRGHPTAARECNGQTGIYKLSLHRVNKRLIGRKKGIVNVVAKRRFVSRSSSKG